jgi:hypothetical protein
MRSNKSLTGEAALLQTLQNGTQVLTCQVGAFQVKLAVSVLRALAKTPV